MNKRQKYLKTLKRMEKLEFESNFKQTLQWAIKKLSNPQILGCCEVCWTNSWVPVPKDYPNALKLKDGSGYVICQMCKADETINKVFKVLQGDKR